MSSAALELRYDPAALEVSRLLCTGFWGEPVSARVVYGPSGSLSDILSFLVFLFGLPESLTPGAESGSAFCRFPKGFSVSVESTAREIASSPVPPQKLSATLDLFCSCAHVEAAFGTARFIRVSEGDERYPIFFAEGDGARYLALDRERPEGERLVRGEDLAMAKNCVEQFSGSGGQS